MPAKDPAARDGKIRSHFFPGANTGVPVALGDPEHLEINERFLKGNKMRVDIFAASSVTTVAANQPMEPALSTMFATGEESEDRLPRSTSALAQPVALAAPLNKTTRMFKPGEDVRIDVVIRTLGLGHFFPAGTVDAFDTWLELKAVDDNGLVLFWSGEVAEGGRGPVDPTAHFYRALQIDGADNPINKRNAWAARATVYVNLIPPGAADVAHYLLRIPKNSSGRIHLEAKLNYRKFTYYYTHEFTFEGKETKPDLPIVTLATATTDLCIGSASGPDTDPVTELDGERWNDYGIGLLRQGDLTGALRAFEQVTKLKPKYADGFVNIARVLIEEGDTREAIKWTDQALQLDPNSGRAHFFRGLALKADGDYDGAMNEFRSVATQYPRDRVNLNQIGRIFFLKRDYKSAIEWFKKTVAIDPEDVSAHYNLMLSYRGLNDTAASAAEEKLYLRFKADESAPTRTGQYRRDHPIDNNERQPIHLHEGIITP
jgi:tetratricopeptide (TPR) repeat protein